MFGPSLHIVGLRQFSGVPARVALQRIECAGMVQVNHRVELLRQAALKVMAPALGFRAVYDTDGALETLSFQQRDRVISLAQINQKSGKTGRVPSQSTVPSQPGKATLNDLGQTRDLERSLSSLDDP